MKYDYFVYKDYLDGYAGEDMFSLKHVIVMLVLFAVLAVVCILCRKAKKESVERYLKIMAIVMPIHEVVKIVWETVWDISCGHGFNYAGLLPLYTCSMFFFILPFAAFGKEKVKKYALAFLTTLGIFAGLTNFIYLNILNTYPLFTFGSMSSVEYHFMMVFTGIFLISTGYYRPEARDMGRAMVCLWIFSLLAVPANFIIYPYNDWVDYMLYMRGASLPVLYDISQFFESINFKFGFTLFMATIGYGFVTALTWGVYKLIMLLCGLGKEKKNGNEKPAVEA